MNGPLPAPVTRQFHIVSDEISIYHMRRVILTMPNQLSTTNRRMLYAKSAMRCVVSCFCMVCHAWHYANMATAIDASALKIRRRRDNGMASRACCRRKPSSYTKDKSLVCFASDHFMEIVMASRNIIQLHRSSLPALESSSCLMKVHRRDRWSHRPIKDGIYNLAAIKHRHYNEMTQPQ